MLSTRALVGRGPEAGSVDHDGTSPQRIVPRRRPAWVSATARISAPGATFQLGSRSAATTSTAPKNWASTSTGLVTTIRPHMPPSYGVRAALESPFHGGHPGPGPPEVLRDHRSGARRRLRR